MTDSTNDQIAEAIEGALTAESLKTRRWVTDELAKVAERIESRTRLMVASPDFLQWRVEENTKRLNDIDVWRHDVDREGASRKEVQALGDKFDNMQKAFLTAALSLACSAVLWAVGVLIATGKVWG